MSTLVLAGKTTSSYRKKKSRSSFTEDIIVLLSLIASLAGRGKQAVPNGHYLFFGFTVCHRRV